MNRSVNQAVQRKPIGGNEKQATSPEVWSDVSQSDLTYTRLVVMSVKSRVPRLGSRGSAVMVVSWLKHFLCDQSIRCLDATGSCIHMLLTRSEDVLWLLWSRA